MSGGPTNFVFVTPEELYAIEGKSKGERTMTLDQMRKAAKSKALCDVCESLPAWKYAQTGMCFTCTTGESDASEDYELAA